MVEIPMEVIGIQPFSRKGYAQSEFLHKGRMERLIVDDNNSESQFVNFEFVNFLCSHGYLDCSTTQTKIEQIF